MFTNFVEEKYKKYENDGTIGRGKHVGITAQQLLKMMRKDFGMRISRKNLWAWIESGVVAEPEVLESRAITKQGKRYFFNLNHVHDLMALQLTIWFVKFVQRRPVYDNGKKVNIIEAIGKLKKIAQTQLLPDDPRVLFDIDFAEEDTNNFGIMGYFTNSSEDVQNLFQFLYFLYRFFFQWFHVDSNNATETDVIKTTFWWGFCQTSYKDYFKKEIYDDMKAKLAVKGSEAKKVTRSEIIGTFLDVGIWYSQDIANEIPFIEFYLKLDDIKSREQGIIWTICNIVFTFSGIDDENSFFAVEMTKALEVFLQENNISVRPQNLCTAAYLLN